jgi:nucleoside-diphosphate-sugar epimerase
LSLSLKPSINQLNFDPSSRIVVLGASGWIGIHLVSFLLDATNCAVECWVRREATAAPLRMLPASGGRLTVRCSERLADLDVPLDTRVVVHGASPTDHWDVTGSIDSNINLTLRLLDALSDRPKTTRLVYLSTLLIRGDSPAPFSECDLYTRQSFLTPYAQAKFLAECAIRTTYVKSVDAIIIRLGSVLWPQNGGNLPRKNWLCQSVRHWRKGILPLIPLLEQQRFYPIPVDELCLLIGQVIASPDVPPVLHLPYDTGPTLGSVFNVLAQQTGQPPPCFCPPDSDQWIEFLRSLPPSVQKRRIAALFPVPPKGARLSTVNSEQSRKWFERGGFEYSPLTEAYWTRTLAASD